MLDNAIYNFAIQCQRCNCKCILRLHFWFTVLGLRRRKLAGASCSTVRHLPRWSPPRYVAKKSIVGYILTKLRVSIGKGPDINRPSNHPCFWSEERDRGGRVLLRVHPHWERCSVVNDERHKRMVHVGMYRDGTAGVFVCAVPWTCTHVRILQPTRRLRPINVSLRVFNIKPNCRTFARPGQHQQPKLRCPRWVRNGGLCES